ncbi:MAG: glycosyltransferase [Ilumatobacteraceae bacterium]|nr:glycosyltransferase [Ilumatobacteraceae bacterium]
MHVTVIAKAPVAGRVKTRLCPPCTHQQAADLAAAALLDTLEAVIDATRRLGVRRVLLLDGHVPSWIPDEFDVVEQCDGTLGDRLSHGFDALGPGLVVGMETPHAVHHLTAAISTIACGDDVVGPALDGGYWAIGLGRVDARAFDGIEMSTSTTGADQLHRLRSMGRRVTLMPEARDIDTFDDVQALARTDGWGRAVRLSKLLVSEISGVSCVGPLRHGTLH